MVSGRQLGLAVAALLLGAALLVSCGGSSGGAKIASTPVAPTNGQLLVRASEWKFVPDVIELTEGEQVTITLQNGGRILHNLKIKDMPANVIASDSTGPLKAKEGDAFVGADNGVRGTLQLVPLKAGTYTFRCTIRGHEQRGMKGTIIVRAAP
jgi:uncharacterized cupredoxin-like copper-binding protein